MSHSWPAPARSGVLWLPVADAPLGGEAAGRKRVRAALTLAIAIHLAFLAIVGLLPAARDGGVDIESIRVFGSDRASFLQPVSLVRVQPRLENHALVVTPLRAVPPRAPRPTGAASAGAGPRPVRTVVAPLGGGGAAPAGVPDRPSSPPAGSSRPASAGPGVTATGGGGAAAVQPSPGQTLGPELPGGGTPLGQVPGDGTGTGQGGGGGTGSGSAGGSGGGGEPDGGLPGGGGGAGDDRPGGTGTGGGQSGFVSRQADRAEPQVTRKGALAYPRGAAEDGIEGAVTLNVLVNETGNVEQAVVTASSGDRRLDQAAKEYVGNWKYLPAVQDGKPRRVWTKARVVFRLQ